MTRQPYAKQQLLSSVRRKSIPEFHLVLLTSRSRSCCYDALTLLPKQSPALSCLSGLPSTSRVNIFLMNDSKGNNEIIGYINVPNRRTVFMIYEIRG